MTITSFTPIRPPRPTLPSQMQRASFIANQLKLQHPPRAYEAINGQGGLIDEVTHRYIVDNSLATWNPQKNQFENFTAEAYEACRGVVLEVYLIHSRQPNHEDFCPWFKREMDKRFRKRLSEGLDRLHSPS